jgi:hypothetical protein
MPGKNKNLSPAMPGKNKIKISSPAYAWEK